MNPLLGFTIQDGPAEELFYIVVDGRERRVNGIRFNLFFPLEEKAKKFLEDNRARMQTPETARLMRAAIYPQAGGDHGFSRSMKSFVYYSRLKKNIEGYVTVDQVNQFIPIFARRGDGWKLLEVQMFGVGTHACDLQEVKLEY